VVGYQCFGGPWYLHLQALTPFSNVVGHQRFGGLCWLHLQVVAPCNDVLGYLDLHLPIRENLKTRKTIILPVVLYFREACSLTVRDEYSITSYCGKQGSKHNSTRQVNVRNTVPQCRTKHVYSHYRMTPTLN